MKLLAVTARSATFAMNNDSAYYAPSPFEVKLCGRVVREGEERNVFSLFNLSPDTEYVAEVCGKKVAFRTAEESLFLSVKDFGAVGLEETVEYAAEPVKVMDGAESIAAGYAFTVVKKTDGTIWAWGNNLNGQLGDGTSVNVRTPVRIQFSADGIPPAKTAGAGVPTGDPSSSEA